MSELDETAPDGDTTMTTDTHSSAQAAAAIVDDYFSTPLRALHDLIEPFATAVADAAAAGPLTTTRIDALVGLYARTALDLVDIPVYGTGFAAAVDLLADARLHLSWWLGEDRRRFVPALEDFSKKTVDYSTLEWYRMPMSTGAPYVAGPYVDYLCSDDYMITIALAAQVDGARIGIAGFDILVSAIDRDLTPRFSSLDAEVTVVNSMGRIVISTDNRLTPGDALRGTRLAGLPRTTCPAVGLAVIVEPR